MKALKKQFLILSTPSDYITNIAKLLEDEGYTVLLSNPRLDFLKLKKKILI